jgi:hypothetical protein
MAEGRITRETNTMSSPGRREEEEFKQTIHEASFLRALIH